MKTYYDIDTFFPESEDWTECRRAVHDAQMRGDVMGVAKLVVGDVADLDIGDLQEPRWDSTIIFGSSRQMVNEILDIAADFPHHSVGAIARMLMQGGIERRKQNLAERAHFNLSSDQ